MALTEGKGIGMTEGQWNEIVQENFRKFNQEADDKKAKILAQRNEMREELQRQMESKKNKEQTLKVQDKQQHTINSDVLENKIEIEQERRRQQKYRFLKDGPDIKGQFKQNEQVRKTVAEIRREEEVNLRLKMENQKREAEEEENRKREEKRWKLMQITNEDRAMKQKFNEGVVDPQEKPDNLMSKVFVRSPHQSYERRAKQDQVTQVLADKFVRKEEEQRKAALISNDFGKNAIEMDEQMRARNQNRKVQEAQMKKVLDVQVLKTQKEKQEYDAEKKATLEKVHQDVQQFEDEQEGKKKAKFEQRRKHQNEVTRQIEDRKKLLKHVGSQVIAQ